MRRSRPRIPPFLLFLPLLAGCAGEETPVVTGRAVLPADTFLPGPPTGARLRNPSLGRTPPFDGVPVQGFSSLVRDGDAVLVLQDNGFGERRNSDDVPLHWYRLDLDLDAGTVALVGAVPLTDPAGHVPFPLRRADRALTGGDLDPESFVRLADGTFWIGEEFGPFLLHADAAGRLLRPPVPVRVPAALAAAARGSRQLRSPDHPDLRSLVDSLAVARAGLPRSGGVEGLALAPDGRRLFVAIEKALVADPEPARRLILEFDTDRAAFTGRWWSWPLAEPGLSIASLACTPGGLLLLTVRDGEQGADARVKRIVAARPDPAGDGARLAPTLVADLLDLADPDGWARAEAGAVGLGPRFAFPYETPECLAVIDARTLLVANDNNYPFSDGRRPGEPDASEFVRLRLPRALEP